MFGIPAQALFGQLLIGLINGSFYAILSLGLAIIFGLLNIINFTHGAQYMMGAFVAWFLLQYAGLGYWWALLIAPIVVGLFGILLERSMLQRLYRLVYGRAARVREVTLGLDFVARPRAASAPPEKAPATLTPWERYAQVLLESNEFMFVD